MKKFLAIFAAAAVVGTTCFAIIQSRKNEPDTDTETTSAYSQTQADYTDISQKSEETSSSVSEQSTEATTEASDEQHSFTGSIEAVSGTNVIVLTDKNCTEYNSSDKFSFGISGIDIADENGKAVADDDVKNFNSVKIFYSGDIMETYPAQVNAQKIVLSERKYCNVKFVVDNTVVKTLRVEKGGSVDSADMPNAGAYCADGYHFECWLDGTRAVSFLSDINDSVTLTAKISKD